MVPYHLHRLGARAAALALLAPLVACGAEPQQFGRPATADSRAANYGQPGQPAAAPAAAAPPRAPTIEEGLGIIKGSLETVRQVKDYQTTFVKREFVDGKLTDYQYMFMKIRQKPFSVYTYFLKPDELKGQEAIFVEGKNNNQLVAHPVGFRKALVGTIQLDPHGSWAMAGQRHPIVAAGMERLLLKMLELSEKEPRFKQTDVRMFDQAKVDGRPCLCLQISQPRPQPGFNFAVARLFIDQEWNVPVRFEAYEYPEKGGDPYLVEEYTYTKLQFNQNMTDLDFDPKNPAYGYR